MGATDVAGRVAASIHGEGPLPPIFSSCCDVPRGGVLLALPSLLTAGLLAHCDKYFQLPQGFYRLDTIFLLLALMALARVKCVESLRYQSPGEWGKLLGLDRIPEARTLREKIKILTEGGEPRQWAGALSEQWLDMEPDLAGVFYIDGHVRVYHGRQTELPRHYVSRQKLCLRATIDFWVNAMDGRPFFLVNKAIDPGLLTVLEQEIVPRLLEDVPHQPSLFELEQDPYAFRFLLIFDREGYSPEFFSRMYRLGIACQTYNKFPGEDWPASEFRESQVTLVSGNVVTMKLAERGVFLGGKIWVREVRKLSESGKQISIVSTDYKSEYGAVAATMFARWSQENFFKYMQQNYNINALATYDLEEIDDTELVTNPLYRDIDGEVRKLLGKLNRKKCEMGHINLHDEIDPQKVERYQYQKAELLEEIAVLEKEVKDLKICKKNTPRRVAIKDLPPEDRFKCLDTRSRDLLDTIKMVAYRAETAMATIVRERLNHADEARALLRAIYTTEADLVPDEEKKILRVRLHQPANHCSARAIIHLCNELNETKSVFPGTELRLVYELVS